MTPDPVDRAISGRDLMPGIEHHAVPSRFSINQMTVNQWALREAVEGCAAAGIRGIGLWRESVADYGLVRAAKLVRDADLAVTSLCRGGFFTGPDQPSRAKAIQENRVAVDEAATLGTEVLILVSGGLPPGSRDLDGARAQVTDALAELAPYAAECGVRLAIEPLHPMFCSDRCVISTLRQALDVASRFPAESVGIVIDAYHVWWDPTLYDQLERAGREERIAIFQVCDWVTPLPAGVLNGRGMIGDGCIELRRLRAAVDNAGYAGPIEVEIFNDALWSMPAADVLAASVARYAEHVI